MILLTVGVLIFLVGGLTGSRLCELTLEQRERRQATRARRLNRWERELEQAFGYGDEEN